MAVALLNLFLGRNATCATCPGDLENPRGAPGGYRKLLWTLKQCIIAIYLKIKTFMQIKPLALEKVLGVAS